VLAQCLADDLHFRRVVIGVSKIQEITRKWFAESESFASSAWTSHGASLSKTRIFDKLIDDEPIFPQSLRAKKERAPFDAREFAQSQPV